jgi:ATP-binding cassette subfamily A (ABC1) protein 1
MICILLAIKETLKDDKTFKPRTIKAVVPTESIKPFSFLDYITAVQTPRTCIRMPFDIRLQDSDFIFKPYSISGISPQNWPVPFLKCDFRKCQREGEDASNYCSVNILAIAPSEEGAMERVEKFQGYINMTYPQINNVNVAYDMVRVFQSAQEIDDYVTSPDYGNIDVDKPKIAVAVVLGGSGKNYEYTIRANSTNFNSLEFSGRPSVPTHPDTSRILRSNVRRAKDACPLEGGTPTIGQMEEHCTVQYIYNGALTIQRLVDDFIIYDTGVKDLGIYVSENGVSFVDFPSKEFISDGFYAQVSAYVPLLVVLGLLYPVAAIIRFIVSEKEMRQKELMKMMSVTESAIELSWFLSSFAFFFVSGIFCTIASSALYPKASPALLFMFWQLGFLSIVVFSMAIASVFSKTTRATVVGILVFFAGYFLTLSSFYDTGSRGVISLVSLHPVAALTYGIQIIGSLEDAGVGVVRSTFRFTDNPSGYTFADAIGSMFVASFFWGYMMWYLNRVIPADYGQPLPWNFMFKKSYWCSGTASNLQIDDGWETNENYANIPIEPVGPAFKEQERVGSGVHIRGLTKVFGEKTAVDRLSLSMYNGQVFSLLGHNGAGKTTTISMLTGMLASSEGYAIVNGKDIRTDMQKIREDIGVCLQHDCLFPMLTVKEHLRFFSRIKGLYQTKSYKEAEQQVDSSIKDVALFEKRNTYSKDLSGGMKRKLSLAIAFCGGSKVVFLDEVSHFKMVHFNMQFLLEVD